MGKTENKPLALKSKLHDLQVKYLGLLEQSKTLCPDFVSVFEEINKDINELDEICKERNRY